MCHQVTPQVPENGELPIQYNSTMIFYNIIYLFIVLKMIVNVVAKSVRAQLSRWRPMTFGIKLRSASFVGRYRSDLKPLWGDCPQSYCNIITMESNRRR